MKKFLTTAAVSLGLAVGPALMAAPAMASPYPGTVPTYCHARAKDRNVAKFQHPRVIMRINTGGNGRPRGSVTIRFTKFNHKFDHTYTRYYNSYHEYWKFPSLKHKGRWHLIVRFHPNNGSVYQTCHDRNRIHVHGRHR